MVDTTYSYTPTPVISHAILTYNRIRTRRLADGIVMTPSHNPPHYGGFKYDPPHGGPAATQVTAWIEQGCQRPPRWGLRKVRRVSLAAGARLPPRTRMTISRPMWAICRRWWTWKRCAGSRVHVGVDPLGGASGAYWEAIGERYGLNLDVVNSTIDPTFRFMTVDWDGQIRMDPSSPYAMARLVA